MIFGDPEEFALESEITTAFERRSLRALGFFVIHLKSVTYGVRAVDATLLACSVDEVEKRLLYRGKHKASFATEPDAGKLADAICQSIYASTSSAPAALGFSNESLRELLFANDIIWAPDGDQAFDDGSCVVQFDEGSRVRLIGFRYDQSFRHLPSTLRDCWVESDTFYQVLRAWHNAFEGEWNAAPKAPE